MRVGARVRASEQVQDVPPASAVRRRRRAEPVRRHPLRRRFGARTLPTCKPAAYSIGHANIQHANMQHTTSDMPRPSRNMRRTARSGLAGTSGSADAPTDRTTRSAAQRSPPQPRRPVLSAVLSSSTARGTRSGVLQVGGLGLVPSANTGDTFAMVEPVHGSAPGGFSHAAAAVCDLQRTLDEPRPAGPRAR